MVMSHQNQITDAKFDFQANNVGLSEQTNVTTTVTTGSWTDSENWGNIAPDSTFVFPHLLNICQLQLDNMTSFSK